MVISQISVNCSLSEWKRLRARVQGISRVLSNLRARNELRSQISRVYEVLTRRHNVDNHGPVHRACINVCNVNSLPVKRDNTFMVTHCSVESPLKHKRYSTSCQFGLVPHLDETPHYCVLFRRHRQGPFASYMDASVTVNCHEHDSRKII